MSADVFLHWTSLWSVVMRRIVFTEKSGSKRFWVGWTRTELSRFSLQLQASWCFYSHKYLELFFFPSLRVWTQKAVNYYFPMHLVVAGRMQPCGGVEGGSLETSLCSSYITPLTAAILPCFHFNHECSCAAERRVSPPGAGGPLPGHEEPPGRGNVQASRPSAAPTARTVWEHGKLKLYLKI